jgi:hypothetical protein
VRRVSRRLYGAVMCLLLVIAVPTLPADAMARAQPAAQTVPDGFEPVTEVPPEEQIPAQPLVAGAYAFIWLAVLVYVGLLWRRLGAVQKDLDALKRGRRADV